MTEAAANVPRLVCEAAIRTLTFHSPGWAWLQDAIVRIIAFAGGRHADGLGIINQCWRDGLLILERLADGTTTVLSPMDCGPIRAAPNPEEVVWVEPYREGRFLVWTPAAHAAQSPQPEPVPPPEAERETAKAETTRWQREPVIAAIKKLYPPDGVRPKGISIAMLTKRINKEPEFQDRTVSEDTVRLADIEIKDPRKK